MRSAKRGVTIDLHLPAGAAALKPPVLIANLGLDRREAWVTQTDQRPVRQQYDDRRHLDAQRPRFNNSTRESNTDLRLSETLRLPPPQGWGKPPLPQFFSA